MRKRLLAAIALLSLALAAVAAWRAIRVASPAIAATDMPAIAIEADAAARRLAGAIAFATVVEDEVESASDVAALHGLVAYLRERFPRAHAALDVERPGGRSLLLRWRGRDAGAPALLFAAHLDVVPAGGPAWTHPPFAGAVADGYVWGRGSLDDKSSILALLEAVEALLATGFVPATDVYLAFGHDEEVGGATGAAAIAETLRARDVRLGCVLDEGSFVLDDVLRVARRPVALVGIAEKGELTVELEARGRGGHAAVLAPDNPAAAVARALARIEAAPFAPRATAAVREMLDALAPEAAAGSRLLLANRWLTERLLVRSLAGDPLTAAMVATTAAPTVFAAGAKDNVIPQRATARLSVRLLDGDSSSSALAHIVAAIDDPAVAVRALPPVHEPSPVSRAQGPGWNAIAGAVAAVFPDAAIVPGPVIATTDARHYVALADDVYRFLPVRLRSGDLERIHGDDERIAIAAHADAVRFYAAVIAAWRPVADR
jgi:carboxypeptidase PM20D1